jgi:hypothetical protein
LRSATTNFSPRVWCNCRKNFPAVFLLVLDLSVLQKIEDEDETRRAIGSAK